MIQKSLGSPSDRLLVAVLVALVVHAGLIVGVHFRLPDPPKINRTLDIELIQQPDGKRPLDADYRAQADSAGDGGEQNKPKPKARFPVQTSPQSPLPQAADLERDRRQPPRLTEDRADASLPIASQAETITEPRLDRNLLTRQIAELGVAATQEMQFNAKERVVPIHQINAHKHIAAAYEHAWQEKVERIGNLNYPDEARRKGLSGSLLASVWVAKDGKVKKIKIHRSSGYRVLDDAAVRIVRLAAPFSPFPMELASQADEIVITRTWKFYDEAGLAMGH